jgi:hypothetical protein
MKFKKPVCAKNPHVVSAVKPIDFRLQNQGFAKLFWSQIPFTTALTLVSVCG